MGFKSKGGLREEGGGWASTFCVTWLGSPGGDKSVGSGGSGFILWKPARESTERN